MIISEPDLPGIRARHADQKIVLTSGSFDLFHIGHLRYLETVKLYGEIMVVLVSGDARIKHRKGPQRPIIPEADRAAIVDALKIADYVLIDPGYNTADKTDPLYAKILEDLRPEVYATDGPDRRFFELEGHNTEMKVVPRTAAETSTSAIIKKISRMEIVDHPLDDG